MRTQLLVYPSAEGRANSRACCASAELGSKGLIWECLEAVALWGSALAPACYLQNSLSHLFSQVSSSGGGLPGRLDLERDSRRSLFLGVTKPPTHSGNPTRFRRSAKRGSERRLSRRSS